MSTSDGTVNYPKRSITALAPTGADIIDCQKSGVVEQSKSKKTRAFSFLAALIASFALVLLLFYITRPPLVMDPLNPTEIDKTRYFGWALAFAAVIGGIAALMG
jgi:hypothetical protein